MLDKVLGGRYSLEEKRGGGGTALVYRGRDSLLNRTVAVKVLNASLTSDNEFVAKFRREAQAAASLSNPHVVGIYDVGEDDGTYYIVMEYVEGKTLKQQIEDLTTIGESEVVDISMQICEGLRHAHRHGVIHRDIKPHNILLTRDGQVKVADFGLARATTTATLTESDSLMGSVHYMSHEQARGGFTSERSDIYSLGVVMYEMLTGKTPYSGDSMFSVAIKHLQETPIPVRELSPSVSEALAVIVERAMSKEQANRYQSAEEMLADLAELPGAAEQLARRGGSLRGSGDLVLRDPKELTDALVQGAENAGSRRANEMAKKKNKKRPSWVVVLTVLMILTMAGIGAGILYMLWPRPEVVVPNIVGLSLAEAQQILREASLEYSIRDGEYNAEVEPGTVIRQSPEAGRTVRAGREVEITPSQGADLKEVPNVVGKTLLEARIALNNEGFAVGQQDTEHSDTIPAGVVISQNPRPPLRAERGTEIDVLVSLGSPIVYVNPPTLVGLAQAEAEMQLRNVGLEVGAVTWEYGSLDFGFVVRQGLSPFERVPRGTLVSIVVSRGKLLKETVVIPAGELAENSRVEVSAEDREGRKIVFDQIRSPSGGDIVLEVEAVAPYYLLVTINGRVYRYERIGNE